MGRLVGRLGWTWWRPRDRSAPDVLLRQWGSDSTWLLDFVIVTDPIDGFRYHSFKESGVL